MPKKKIFNSVITSLKQAITYEKGTSRTTVRTHSVTIRPVPQYHGDSIKRIRLRLNLSQRSFAIAIGVSVKTVEAWEAGKNIPAGPAQRMLSFLEKDNTFLKRYGVVHIH